MPFINMIYAANQEGIIGHQGGIPWHVPEDFQYFKNKTMGHTVAMGRKTWESLPEKFRPLPGRKNIILSSRWEDVFTELYAHKGVEVFKSVQEVAELTRWHTEQLWVIGGNQIYNSFLPYTNYIYKTEIEYPCVGDTVAPPLDVEEWELNSQGPWLTSKTGTRYRFLVYRHYSSPKNKPQ